MKIVFLEILLLVLFTYLSFSQGSNVAKKVMPSTAMIVTEDANGQTMSQGSGFFVKTNVVATNFHVIENARRGYIKLINENRKVNIEGVVGIDKEHDIVLLSVSTYAPALSLGDFTTVETGDNIYVVGNPRGLEGTFSQGIVSSIRDVDGDKLLQITAPISPGSSGGPVLNSKGEVIGVSVSTYKDGQNLNFAVPSTYLKFLIDNMKSSSPLGSESSKNNSSYTKKIGSKITDGVYAHLFNWRYPNGRDYYYFTIKNNLRENISNILIYVLFFDLDGNLFDTHIIKYNEIIPGGLAKRVEENKYDDFIIQKKTTIPGESAPKKYEIRIIDFEIVE